MCLDCELMPWSAKAQALIRDQYAAVGAAAVRGLAETVGTLRTAAARSPECGLMLERFSERAGLVDRYVQAYRQYSWPVNGLEDLRLAPFHLLASEGKAHLDRDHRWHMDTLARLAGAGGPVLMATPHKMVNLLSHESEAEATKWWLDLTGRGGEGMVVKPLDFLARGTRGWVQPAVKCRGPEYLRIIYGPEYTLAANLDRLRLTRAGCEAVDGDAGVCPGC